MPRMLRVLCFGIAWTLLLPQARADEKASSAELSFERDIRPVLKVHCFHCHGEAGEQQGKLDVRLRRSIMQGGETGAAIAPGHSDESMLVERMRNGEMPPGKKKVPPAEIALVARWIDQGAKTLRPEPEQLATDEPTDEERAFWSFQPVRRPTVPSISTSQEVRTPIDAFIAAQLVNEHLTLSPEADQRTLIRRATFDLLGLPPTPEEVELFVADKAPDACERLIDRLLTRPEYGERWGRHWLDLAGYADSDGYTPQDPVRAYAYKYRDYVIRSLNADKPFDQFVREQLAGDELAGPRQGDWRPEQLEILAATGFLRMGPDGTGIVASTEQDVARNQVVADTIKIASTTLLGLSLGCAQCHDHKYDPVSQADYYRFRAIFEPALDWKKWRPPAARLVSVSTQASLKLKADIEAEAKKIDAERQALADKFIAKTLDEELAKLPDDIREQARAATKTPADKRTAEQKKLVGKYPALNVTIGSLYLYDRARRATLRTVENERNVRRKQLIADASQRALDAAPEADRARLKAARDKTADNRLPEERKLLGKYPAVLVSSTSLAQFDQKAAAEVAELERKVQAASGELATEQLDALAKRAADVRAKKPVEDFVQALTEPAGPLPTTCVFHRGEFNQPRQQVEPGEPRVLDAPGKSSFAAKDMKLTSSGRRLALANRLTDGTHPLVARVLVNRLWAHHFGRGIVQTTSDFGQLGARPTHPELLDWLASELVDGGWKLKRMHKLIMTSAAYRQRSDRTPRLDMVDPDNKLVGRMNVRRLEAETLRDAILAVCGRLNHKRFGAAVPVMPDEVGQFVIGIDTRDTAGRPTAKFVPLYDEAYRRSIYVQVRRSMPLGMLEAFDAPTMTTQCNCELRSLSTVAPQSLIMMNSEFLVDHATYMAWELSTTGTTSDAQVSLAWLRAFARPPDADEFKQARSFLASQQAALRTTASVSDKVDPSLRALATLCQALLGSNEFLYVD